jgi:hypothetical protein
MTQFAIEAGKIVCASRVIGKDNVENKTGGMTSLNLFYRVSVVL